MLQCVMLYRRFSKNTQFVVRYKIHTLKSHIFRLVHPDLFNNESLEVQDINLKCLQSLSEFFDTWNTASKQLIGGSGDISVASIHFNREYDFSCYVRLKAPSNVSLVTTCQEQTRNNLLFSPFILRPPTTISSISLNKQCSYLSKQEATLEMNALKREFLSFAKSLGIAAVNDFPEDLKLKPSDAKNRIKGFTSSQNVNVILETLKFERIMATSYNHSFHSIFNSNKKNSKSSSNKFLSTEIDYYLQNGHIYVRQLSVQEEFEVMNRFRDFILHYGEMVYFSSVNWQNMVFVFYGDSSFDYHDKSKEIQISKSKYACEFKSDMFVFEIPHKFKNNKLVMLMTDHIERLIKY